MKNVKRYLRGQRWPKPMPKMLEPIPPIPLPTDLFGIDPQNYALWQGVNVNTGEPFDPKTFDWDAWSENIKAQCGKYRE